MAAARSLASGTVPGGRVVPCGRPLVPPVINRACRCRTMGFTVPVAAMMPVVQKTSAPGRCSPQQAAKAGRYRDLRGEHPFGPGTVPGGGEARARSGLR